MKKRKLEERAERKVKRQERRDAIAAKRRRMKALAAGEATVLIFGAVMVSPQKSPGG